MQVSVVSNMSSNFLMERIKKFSVFTFHSHVYLGTRVLVQNSYAMLILEEIPKNSTFVV